jgi:multidrug efflux pump subunit AcrB
MLMALVVKNAILLVDFFNQARQRGTAVPEALGKEALQPLADELARRHKPAE